MNIKYILLIFMLLAFKLKANEVENACITTGLNVVKLQYRETSKNINKIKASNHGKSAISTYLSRIYRSTAKFTELESLAIVRNGNEKFISNSDIKTDFMKYNSAKQKLADPVGYRSTLIKLINKLVLSDSNKTDWFLNLKDNILIDSELTPAKSSETGEVYGAVTELLKKTNSKFSLKIIFSNNDSESIPYLIPLVIHEYQHAITYKEKIANYNNEKKYIEDQIVEEAKAFNIQMQTYLELAKRYPELFCNWLVFTWSYGEIPVPLSWTMASMESEMMSGNFISRYAKMGTYQQYLFLLDSTGTKLRKNLLERISNLKLEFVK
jgi:hypothetical protein